MGGAGMAPSATRARARRIRPAESDDDARAIHRFLRAVAGPVLHCPVNHEKSFVEALRMAGGSFSLTELK